MKLSFILLAGVLAVGCKDKDERAADGKAAGKATPEAAGGDLEPVTVTSDGVVVEARVPKGWKRTDLNDAVSYSAPNTIIGSSITISATCGGDCGSIAANAGTLGDALVKAQQGAGYQATVTRTTNLANGIELELEATKADRDPLEMYVKFIHDPSLPSAAQCMVMGVGKDAKAARTSLAAGCAALSLKAK